LGGNFCNLAQIKKRGSGGSVKGASGFFGGKDGHPSSFIVKRKKCEAAIFRQ